MEQIFHTTTGDGKENIDLYKYDCHVITMLGDKVVAVLLDYDVLSGEIDFDYYVGLADEYYDYNKGMI